MGAVVVASAHLWTCPATKPTTATDIKVAKELNSGLCFLTAKITCSSSFENGDIIATLPPGYFTPTSFDKPVFATPQPAMGDKDMSKADHVSFNTNNGEIRLSLSVFPEAGMWLKSIASSQKTTLDNT